MKIKKVKLNDALLKILLEERKQIHYKNACLLKKVKKEK